MRSGDSSSCGSSERASGKTYVIDRPGEWGPLYDQVLDEVEAAGDLVILQNGPEDEAYSAANHAILDEAVGLAKAAHEPEMVVLMWDRLSRGHHDLTEDSAPKPCSAACR